MSLKVCLLVTDDPDDHQAFSEAVSEISDNTIVLIVLDSQKAIELLQTKKLLPDLLFLDLSMHGIRINSFLKVVHSNDELQAIPTTIYGEAADFDKIENKSGVTFFSKDYEYSELQEFLRTLLAPPKG